MKMMKMFKIVVFSVFLLNACLLEALAVKVGPVRFDVSVERGKSSDFTLNLIGSKGSYTQGFVIYSSDLSMSRQGALSFKRTDGKNSAAEWIKIDKSELTLFEEERKQVTFSITVPYNAVPGEYYAVIMVEPKEFSYIKSDDHPFAVKVKSKVAVVIVLNVPGRVYQKQGLVYDSQVIQTDSLVAVIASFENNGNIHLNVTGKAIVRSADGRYNYGEFELKAPGSSQPEAFIFPGAIRDFEGALYRKLPTGDYMVEVIFDYGYEFKKATRKIDFSVKRKVSVNEKDAQFLSLDNNAVNLTIPAKGRRAHVVTLTNTDYRPLDVIIESDECVKISTENISLKAGEKRNILLSISVDEFENDKKEKKTIVVFKPDRGKSAKYLINIDGNINK